jgi:PsbP-like protein
LIRLSLSGLSSSPYIAVLAIVLVLLLLQPISIIGTLRQAMAEQQQQPDLATGTILTQASSLSFPPSTQIDDSNNNNSSDTTQTGLNKSIIYDNSTYGIKFQSPYGWNKVEILFGRITNIEFTSPTGNATSGAQLPAQVMISIERGLGNVTTLGQYSQVSDKLLHAILGNFNSTASKPTTLSGQPAIARVLDVKQPASGIHINIAQVFTIKDSKAYSISYAAPASTYFSYFPILQRIINSFQITK